MRETHKSEIIQFQQWCKPVISDLLGVDNYDRFCQAPLKEYDKFIYLRIAKYEFLRKVTIKKFMINKDEEYGWATVVPKSDAYIAVDYTKCGCLTDWFRDQGVPEIAPIACEGDYIEFAL